MIKLHFYNQSVLFNLLSIKGIGPSSGRSLCLKIGVPPSTLLSSLTPKQTQDLLDLLNTYKIKFGIDTVLTKKIDSNIKRMIKINSYRGIRHKLGYPVRGQRTRPNARTARKRKGLF